MSPGRGPVRRANRYGGFSWASSTSREGQAEDAVDVAGDKIGDGIDKAADMVDDKTGGKFDDKIDMGGRQGEGRSRQS